MQGWHWSDTNGVIQDVTTVWNQMYVTVLLGFSAVSVFRSNDIAGTDAFGLVVRLLLILFYI